MDKSDLEHQMSETGILRVAVCSHVAVVLDIFEDSKFIYIVQEMIEGQNLFDFVLTKQRNEKIVRNIMRGIV